MVMILGMSLTTFAADVNVGDDGVIGTSDDTGTIEVTGIKAEEGKNITVTAYKIIEAEYNAVASTSNQATFSGYKNLYSPGIADMEHPSVSELYTIKSTIDSGSISGRELPTKTESEGILTFSGTGFEVGSYLIVVSGSEATTYSLAVASIRYVDKEGNWVLESEGLDMLDSDTVWLKSTTGPTVEKEVKNGASGTAGSSATADIGDELTYTVIINPVPKYDGQYPVLNIEDQLSEGLVFTSTEDNVSVVATAPSGSPVNLTKEDYDIEINNTDRTLSVDFVLPDVGYTLNGYAGGIVVITYTVKVTDDVQQNQIANTNDVTLTYSKDSNVNSNNGTDDDTTYTYTFDIDGAVDGSLTEGIITKVGETVTGQSSQPLEGAVFRLYTSYDASLYQIHIIG